MSMNVKAWYDKAFLSISALSGSEVALQSRTTNFSKSGGGFDVEGLDTFAGKITKVGTKEDIELSFDGLQVSHQDFDWIEAGQANATTSAFGTGGATISTNATTLYRVALLWTNQVGVTSGTQAVTGANEAYRKVYANAYCTSLEPEFEAGDILKCTIKFKMPFEDENGAQNWITQSKDTTSGTLSAIAAYTATTGSTGKVL